MIATSSFLTQRLLACCATPRTIADLARMLGVTRCHALYLVRQAAQDGLVRHEGGCWLAETISQT